MSNVIYLDFKNRRRIDGPKTSQTMPKGSLLTDKVFKELERELIVDALNQTGCVFTDAARLLNWNKSDLIEKVKLYNITINGQKYGV